MPNPHLGNTGKSLIGRITFAAATLGSLDLKQGGQWKAGQYSLQVSCLRRTLDTIDIVAVNSTPYTLTIDGRTYTITSDGTATTQEIRDAFIALINASSPANGVVAAIVDADTFSITGLVGGANHVVAESDANLTLTRGIDALPNFAPFVDDGQIVIRTAAAFTGIFDVFLQG